MPEDLYCAGQRITNQDTTDGWFRTFRGYPKMNGAIKSMLKTYAKKGQMGKMLVFFVCKCEYDNDYSEFLIRDFMRGYI